MRLRRWETELEFRIPPASVPAALDHNLQLRERDGFVSFEMCGQDARLRRAVLTPLGKERYCESVRL